MWIEKNFEEKMTKHIDQIYREVFGDKLSKIYRSNRENQDDKKLLFMDIELSIDTHLTFFNGSVLTFQEKTLRYTKQRFNQFTFEYYNDPRTKEEGEWFKLAAQLYFFGYANKNESGYDKFWILNVAKLRTRLMSKYNMDDMHKFLRHNKPPARANFFAIPFEALENLQDVVVYKFESKQRSKNHE